MSLASETITRSSSGGVGRPPVGPMQHEPLAGLHPSTAKRLSNPGVLERASSAPALALDFEPTVPRTTSPMDPHAAPPIDFGNRSSNGIRNSGIGSPLAINAAATQRSTNVPGGPPMAEPKKLVYHPRYDYGDSPPSSSAARTMKPSGFARSVSSNGAAVGALPTSTDDSFADPLADPEYAQYYRTHRALNPRLPAPLKSRQPVAAAAAAGVPGRVVADQPRTVIDRIQADFPRTPSPAIDTATAAATPSSETQKKRLKPHPLVHSASSVTLSSSEQEAPVEPTKVGSSSSSYAELSRAMHALDLRKNEPEPQPTWQLSPPVTDAPDAIDYNNRENASSANKGPLTISTTGDAAPEGGNASFLDQSHGVKSDVPTGQSIATTSYAQNQHQQQMQHQYMYSPQSYSPHVMGYMASGGGFVEGASVGTATAAGVPTSPYLNAMQEHALAAAAAAGQAPPGYFGYQAGYQLPPSAMGMGSASTYVQPQQQQSHLNKNGTSMMPSSRSSSDASAGSNTGTSGVGVGLAEQQQGSGMFGSNEATDTSSIPSSQDEELDIARQHHALGFIMQSPLGHPLEAPGYLPSDFGGGPMLSPALSPMYQAGAPQGGMPLMQSLPPPAHYNVGGQYHAGGEVASVGGLMYPMSPMYHPVNPYTFTNMPTGENRPQASTDARGSSDVHPSMQQSGHTAATGSAQYQLSPQQQQQQQQMQQQSWVQPPSAPLQFPQYQQQMGYWPTNVAGRGGGHGVGESGGARFGQTQSRGNGSGPRMQLHNPERRAGSGGRAAVGGPTRANQQPNVIGGGGGGQRRRPYQSPNNHRLGIVPGGGGGQRGGDVGGLVDGGAESQIPRNELLEELRNKMKAAGPRSRHGGSPLSHPGQDGGQAADGTGSIVDWGLAAMAGHVQEFARDQFGSRFIQQQLESPATLARDKEAFFEEVLPHAPALCVDVFGNYVIQKIFEPGVATVAQQRKLVMDTIKGHMLELSLHMYACRVVQKVVERLFSGRKATSGEEATDDQLASDTSSSSNSSSSSDSSESDVVGQVLSVQEQDEILGELAPFVMQCVEDQNGNHVIQKCIEQVRPIARIEFILGAFVGKLPAMSSHLYGCRVVQRMLEHCDAAHVAPTLAELTRDVHRLVQDQYGNYVVQHVIQHGRRAYAEQRAVFLQAVRGQLLAYSTHKFASNVVEKCLQFGTAQERRAIIAQMLGHVDANDVPIVDSPAVATPPESDAGVPPGSATAPLHIMMKDPYANYVVQKVLDIAEPDQLEQVVAAVRSNEMALRSLPYGRHILTRLDKISLQAMTHGRGGVED
jgi:hypothetical protein